MAYARRAPQHQESLSPSTRKYPLRRSPPSRRPRHTEGPSDSLDIRQVLVPLHPNLRRLPSRLTTQDLPIDKNSHMARHVAQVGSKRKRVTSVNTSNENVSHSTRAWTRSKRLKSETRPRTRHAEYNTTSEEDGQEDVDECAMDGPEESSEMDIDSATAQGSTSGASDPEANPECDDEDAQDAVSDPGDEDDSTDEHLLNSAPPKQLARLRKHDLIRLYCLTGLSDEADLMTKSDIISAILSARDDFAELPPSSPPGHVDGNSSEYSSDDGNVAGGEETDTSQNLNGASGSGSSLRRRATMGDATKGLGRQIKGRSASMGHLLSRETNGPLGKRKTPGHVLGVAEGRAVSRQRTSSRSSPSTSTTTSISSSVTTRLRSKKLSAFSPSTPDKTSKGKGKAKQVEFSEGVIVPSKRRRDKQRERERESERAKLRAEESDLTELEELEASLTKPSPRRLRSKGRDIQVDEYGADKAEVTRTPSRKAKGKIQSLKEEDDENDEGEGLAMHEESESSDEGVDAEEEEVDELISSTSATPTPPPYKGRRTPLRTRLRPRRRPAPPSSDGDDEGCNVEEAGEEADEAVESIEEGEEDEDEVEVGTEDTEDDETVTLEPRKLRNGKIVEDVPMEEEEDIEEECLEEDAEDGVDGGDEDEEGQDDEGVETGDVDVDAEGEMDEDEGMEEDDVDLTVATAKTLIRLRRDDLVRLCETRDLEPVGTKPQLAEALLQWRDRQNNDFSSPSSSGTVRPSSTSRRRTRTGARTSEGTPSARSLSVHMHMHEDEPATPVPTHIQKEKDKEDADLELDLESLGLEDREIPPEKLQKLEKIGSGGFKDVFIGKFKGRKIAISEFRGQLSAMDIKELKLLGGFDHPNIVRFLGVSIPENTKETPVMIVSELCSNGDLFDYIRNVPPQPIHKVLAVMLDIARGLEYLHLRKPSVIHRDCKSSNILITAKGTAKIADFGLAKVKQSTRSMVRSLVGTVNWQAPELWHAHPKYNHKVDVFSCAMVFWEILQWHLPNIKFPWEGMNEHAIYEIVGAKRQRPSISGLRKHWCPDIVDLIERMWAQEHQDRPTMSEVVEALEEMVAH